MLVRIITTDTVLFWRKALEPTKQAGRATNITSKTQKDAVASAKEWAKANLTGEVVITVLGKDNAVIQEVQVTGEAVEAESETETVATSAGREARITLLRALADRMQAKANRLEEEAKAALARADASRAKADELENYVPKPRGRKPKVVEATAAAAG